MTECSSKANALTPINHGCSLHILYKHIAKCKARTKTVVVVYSSANIILRYINTFQ